MKVAITGAGGFVGNYLTDFFTGRGDEVTGIGRSRPANVADDSLFTWIQADTTQKGGWQDEIDASDVVVNLAGKNIFGRWTEKIKQEILESRVRTTENVVEGFSGNRPAVLLSTSAVGYYGDGGDELLDESAAAGDDFLARVCIDWEGEANRAADKGVRVANMRFSMVLEKTGGALKMMLPAFKAFVGGPLGTGKQFMPWIHMGDLIRAHSFVIEHAEIIGPVNCCAPNPLRNEDFSRMLGSVLGRPSVFRVPRFALSAAMGEMGEMVLSSQRAVPEKLLNHGFEFRFPEIRGALEDILA